MQVRVIKLDLGQFSVTVTRLAAATRAHLPVILGCVALPPCGSARLLHLCQFNLPSLFSPLLLTALVMQVAT